jgi:hypothetical protein
MIKFKVSGDFSKTKNSLKKLKNVSELETLEKYGQLGVEALRAATPKKTGKTANSWDYEIVKEGDKASIFWTNSNINKNVNIAVILQYGHGTKQGTYVQGIDYINPAMRPVFESIANDAWKEVTNA